MDRIDLSSIPHERRKEILEQHQDTKTLDIGGTEFTFHMGGVSFGIAREHDLDFAEILNEEAPENDTEAGMDQMAYLLFVGCVPFDEDLSPAEMKMRLSFEDIPRLQKKIMPDVQEAAAEYEGHAAGKVPA